MTPDEIESEALKLDLELRTRLVQRLTKSLEELSENEKERLWLQEAMKRSRELRAQAAPLGEGPDDRPAGGEESGLEAPVTRPVATEARASAPAVKRPRKPSRRPRAAPPRRKKVARPVRAKKKRLARPAWRAAAKSRKTASRQRPGRR